MYNRVRDTSKNGKTTFNIKEVAKLKGQVRYIEDVENEMFYKVVIENVFASGCNLKVSVKPEDGIGTSETCLTMLYTAEEVETKINNLMAAERFDEAYNDMTSGHYQKERRAKFLKIIEDNCSPEELEALTEEAGNLNKVSDHFMREHGSRILRAKFKNVEVEDDE